MTKDQLEKFNSLLLKVSSEYTKKAFDAEQDATVATYLAVSVALSEIGVALVEAMEEDGE